MIVRGATVVDERGAMGAGVRVTDGVVAEVGPELAGGGAGDLDARGLLALPGVVDAHVHLNDPGRAHWEGFATGTPALAAGVTTRAIEMALTALPRSVDGEKFDAKAAAAA